ncbi:MAG: Trk system potassium transporter TrkA [Ruminococcus sp.]|nr:Trk system potassium transporter TrkA [Ruminococcus sp.]
MDIIVVGCGKVGQTLAVQLNNDGNNITVIDLNPDKVSEVTDRHDIMGVVGNGAIHTVQQEAGIQHADLLIAVTGSDELNLLCCLIAKMAGNCQTIARVRSPQYSSEAQYLKDELGLAMIINPEFASAAEIARILRFPSAIKIDTFARGRVELLKFRLPEDSPIVGMSVKDVMIKLKSDVLICTIERDGEAYIANGDSVFRERDIISLVAAPKKATDFFSKIKYKTRSVRDVMIVGGGEITHYLADILLKSDIAVKVIEKDKDKCEEMCASLPGVTVIHGDAVDQGVLMEEGLENAGAFVALTNLDEENILLSLFAKNKNKGKLIAKINRIEFDDVVSQLDLDTVIYPRHLTSESIIRYVRAMKNTIGSNVETLYIVIKDKVEASEFIVRENCAVTGVPLGQLKFKKNVLVAAILRDKKVIIPHGGDVIQPGDAVVIVSEIMALHDITDVLR